MALRYIIMGDYTKLPIVWAASSRASNPTYEATAVCRRRSFFVNSTYQNIHNAMTGFRVVAFR